ncbi:MAG: HEAT repeat domain-containing protein [Verrucomicrobiota bacterium]|nr:HEAT repeat domain-containing protein [Verrucomicrobiota bacterium]
MHPCSHLFLRKRFLWYGAWSYLFSLVFHVCLLADPVLLDDQFNLPDGFHIYKAAERDMSGGSYDITFDGDGRLLVGDGKNVRRLADTNQDQTYDAYEIIAKGLGGRGPQGLAVYGDYLYAVGGDGVQLFSGYQAGGALKHEQRLGAPFNTGGDHAAHTIMRGLDGFMYFVTGDGGGVGERKHITEDHSPVLFERNASVFRFDRFGEQWECLSTGGRNPPSLGMNYLGECFSFDSDMEWHVALPFYRPVRLNHWVVGGDQGWQQVGAYPAYYLDCLPPVLEVGRGSPNWGIFYEHVQFPKPYRDAFLACDYQWKSASSGSYASPGRLVAFHLERKDATWSAEMSVLAQPKEGAILPSGEPIHFALVDVDVAPDGSLFLSDHNQGIWRLFYDAGFDSTMLPPMVRPSRGEGPEENSPLDAILKLPQPMAEWSRLQEQDLFALDDAKMVRALKTVSLDDTLNLRRRLRAIRLLAPRFRSLPTTFVSTLALDAFPEIRGQAAWLMGLRQQPTERVTRVHLLEDSDPFVRRRAAESFNRSVEKVTISHLRELLNDADRYVRYSAMTALAHYSTAEIVAAMDSSLHPRILMRMLVATDIRRERASQHVVQTMATPLLAWSMKSPEERQDTLDLLRVLGLFRKELQSSKPIVQAIQQRLVDLFTSASDRLIRWESARLLGEYDVGDGFALLLDALEVEKDGVTQFHFAEALSRIRRGFHPGDSRRFIKWIQSTQKGWFADLDGKGRQFSGFWSSVMARVAGHHSTALLDLADGLEPDSLLSSIALDAIKDLPGAERVLLQSLHSASTQQQKYKVLRILQGVRSPLIAPALIEAYDASEDPIYRAQLIITLSAQPIPEARQNLFLKALMELDQDLAIEPCADRIIQDGLVASQVAQVRYRGYEGTQAVGFRCMELMTLHPKRIRPIERMLQAIAGVRRPDSLPELQCIWISDQQIADERAWFSKVFHVPEPPGEGRLIITCDNAFVAYLNGKEIGRDVSWESVEVLDLPTNLKQGRNVIAIAGLNHGGPAGLAAVLRWTTQDGSMRALATDGTWRVTGRQPDPRWQFEPQAGIAWRPGVNVSQATENVMKVMAPFVSNQAASSTEEVIEWWQDWYRLSFHQPYVPVQTVARIHPRSNHLLRKMLLEMNAFNGNPAQGRQVYLKAGCFACHGGTGVNKGTLFGPALTGVTQRLNREELADAIVYPSKQVAERFKATQVTLKDGQVLDGFLTGETDELISVTDLSNRVTQVPKSEILAMKAQDSSLMPEMLLNGFSESEILDLMTFIHQFK